MAFCRFAVQAAPASPVTVVSQLVCMHAMQAEGVQPPEGNSSHTPAESQKRTAPIDMPASVPELPHEHVQLVAEQPHPMPPEHG
jgi:hypothetical protein